MENKKYVLTKLQRIFLPQWNIYDILPWETIVLSMNFYTEKLSLGNVSWFLFAYYFVLF